MRYLRFLLPVFILVCLSGCATSHDQRSPLEHITILHWNDFHSRNVPFAVTKTDSLTGEKYSYEVSGSANLAGYLDYYGRGKDNVAVLVAGDDFQGTPISTVTKGRSQIELLNLIKPDAFALGNHEFDYGSASLRETLRSAKFPILAANLYDSTTSTTFAPSTMLLSIGRVEAGIIGFLPPDLPILTMHQNLTHTSMLNVDSILDVTIPRLRREDHADLIIVLSHMGVDRDSALAMRRQDIDVIVGGHTHTPLFTPIKKGRTIIVQAGDHGKYLGKLDLAVDLEGDSVSTFSGELIETRLGVHPSDPVITKKASALESQVDHALSEVIGTLHVDWKRTFSAESNIGNWEADVMRSYAKTDIAFQNSGGIRKDMVAGPITMRDMWEVNPFGNTLLIFSVPGDTLRAILEWQASGKGEFVQVSGVTYRFDSTRPEGSKLLEATVGGNPIDPGKLYSIATNNYVGGHTADLLGVQPWSFVLHDLGLVDREMFVEYIKEHRDIRSAVEGRVVDVSSTNHEQ